jgi:hypothetical protein
VANIRQNYSKFVVYFYLNFESKNVPPTRTAEKIAAFVSMSLVLDASDGSTAATPVRLLFFLCRVSDVSSTSSSSLKAL